MQQQYGSLESSGAAGGAASWWLWHRIVLRSMARCERQRARTESSGMMMQAVQGWTNERDSSSGGPTNELRRNYHGRSAPTGRGVIDSGVQWYSSEAVQQCSGW